MHWLNLLGQLPGLLQFVILLGAAVAAFFALKQTVYKPIRAHFNRVNKGMDSLLGYPAVVDPDGTGRILKDATPPLVARVHNLEIAQAAIAHAIETVADTQKHVLQLQESWSEREKAGTQIIKEWTNWRDSHEAEANKREDRLAEWEKWRHEQTLLTESLLNVHEAPHNNN